MEIISCDKMKSDINDNDDVFATKLDLSIKIDKMHTFTYLCYDEKIETDPSESIFEQD